MPKHSTDTEDQSGDNRDRLRDNASSTPTSTNISKKSPNQLPTLGQLFQACINSDITTMKDIIKTFSQQHELKMMVMNNEDTHQSDASGSVDEDDWCPFYSDFRYDLPLLDQKYNMQLIYDDIPQIFDCCFSNSLLDAAVLSNSPKTIDFVFKQCSIKGYGRDSFWEENHECDCTLGIGQSALVLALTTNNMDSFQHLMDKYCGKFVDSYLNHEILNYLLDPDQLPALKLFLQHSPSALLSMTEPEPDGGYDYFHRVVQLRNDELIQYIISLGVSIDIHDYEGHSVLLHFVREKEWDMVQHLITTYGADWDSHCEGCGDCNQGLLEYALEDSDLPIKAFDFIINYIGVEFHTPYAEEGQTPLLLTARAGDLSLVKRLINHHHANINAVCTENRNLLHYAVASNNLDLIQYIIDDPMFNFDINVIYPHRYHYYTPLSKSIEYLSLDVVKFMVEHKADIMSDIILDARTTGFEFDSDDDEGHFGFNPQPPHVNILPLAATNPDSNVLQYLLEQIGINHLSQEEIDECMIEAIQSRRLDTAQLLIEKYNANRNIAFPNTYGIYPKTLNIFHFTLKHNRYCSDFIRFLQPSKQELEVTNSDGETSLFMAAKSRRDVQCLRTLVEFGADIHVINKTNNENVLHAVLSDTYWPGELFNPVLKYVIDSNVDMNAKCSTTGQTPLHYAAKINNKYITRLLLKNGANIDQVDINGNTPLIIAAQHNSDIPLQILIKNRTNINIQNKKGQTAIHLAASHFHSSLVSSLSKLPCSNINIRDKQGNTPLLLVPLSPSPPKSLYFTQFEPKWTIRSLLTSNANPTFINKNNQTILHLITCSELNGLDDVLIELIDSIIDWCQ